MKFYTIGCPACNVLESKLKSKGIEYEKIESEDAIRDLGFDSAPLLEVDGRIMDFAESIKYLSKI